MPRRPISFEGRPLLDIATYARRGPGRSDRLSPGEIELISRTVRRMPEVMVKVLTRGGQNLGAVRKHFEYLNRKGEFEIETDDGQRLAGKGVEKELLDDWDLDIEEDRHSARLEAKPRRAPPKLVHKVLFSMPPGTSPQKVLEAVKNFAREEFGLKHRYAMVLHTDEPHPHVHMVIKAVSEQGERLNIRKATLRGGDRNSRDIYWHWECPQMRRSGPSGARTDHPGSMASTEPRSAANPGVFDRGCRKSAGKSSGSNPQRARQRDAGRDAEGDRAGVVGGHRDLGGPGAAGTCQGGQAVCPPDAASEVRSGDDR